MGPYLHKLEKYFKIILRRIINYIIMTFAYQKLMDFKATSNCN